MILKFTCIENAFICVLVVTILNVKVKYRFDFDGKNMKHKLNSCRNQKSGNNVQQIYRKVWFWRPVLLCLIKGQGHQI